MSLFSWQRRELDDFKSLFEGRLDVVGANEGQCIRVVDQLWENIYRRHLWGTDPIGVYPLYENGLTAWGCVDIDEDTIEHAWNLQTCLDTFHVESWIERSRSKGYHVWVLLPGGGTTRATLMRKALQAACQIVGAPDKEVNPKQTELGPGQVGNYVRLPYPGVWNALPERQVILRTNGTPMPFSEFLDFACATGDQITGLDLLAEKWIDPHPPVVRPVPPPSSVVTDPVRRMSALAFVLWRDGPKFPDRSAAIWRLICELVQQGAHTEGEIIDLVCDADVRWGKYQQRPNGRDVIERQVRKAWG